MPNLAKVGKVYGGPSDAVVQSGLLRGGAFSKDGVFVRRLFGLPVFFFTSVALWLFYAEVVSLVWIITLVILRGLSSFAGVGGDTRVVVVVWPVGALFRFIATPDGFVSSMMVVMSGILLSLHRWASRDYSIFPRIWMAPVAVQISGLVAVVVLTVWSSITVMGLVEDTVERSARAVLWAMTFGLHIAWVTQFYTVVIRAAYVRAGVEAISMVVVLVSVGLPFFGTGAMALLLALLYVAGFGDFRAYYTNGVTKKACPSSEAARGAALLMALTERTNLPLSSATHVLESVVWQDLLTSAGSNEKIRQLAQLGDVVLRLALQTYCFGLGTSVGDTSDMHKGYLSNKNFRRYWQQCLSDLVPTLVGRSEHTIGTFLELLVGAAHVSGCPTIVIQKFITDKLMKVEEKSEDFKVSLSPTLVGSDTP